VCKLIQKRFYQFNQLCNDILLFKKIKTYVKNFALQIEFKRIPCDILYLKLNTKSTTENLVTQIILSQALINIC
jgi:hypothetical protein